MVLSKKSFVGLTLAALMSSTALAQESTSDGNSSTVTYNEEYFVPYNPVTLQDMLRSVPGTAALLAKADEELTGRRVRGFGSAGDQILIDGKRIAGKTNSLGLQLKRIQATQVSRIELIRGTKAGLDVQSEGLIINVIMRETASKSNTVWTIGGQYVENGQINPLAKVTHTGERGNLKYNIGVDFALEETRKKFTDTFFDAAGNQYSSNQLLDVDDRTKTFINANIEYNAENGDVLRLNGQLEFDKNDTIQTDTQSHLANIMISNPITGGVSTFVAGDTRFIQRDRAHRPFHWEFGGDYEHRFESLGLWKTLWVINHGVHDWDTTFQSGDNGEAIAVTGSNFSERDHGEKILRSSLLNTFWDVHTIEYGGEVAINDVSTTNRSRRADGSVIESSLGDIDVQEVRFEAFASHNWSIASNISLQSSLNAEWSEISQTNNLMPDDPDFTRDFFFLKPRWNLRYDIDEQNQLRVTVERKISQLDFGAFGSSFDLEDDETDGGNAELKPEDRWEFSVAYENRFAEDQGSISIKGFYNKIRDHIARIGVGPDTLDPATINQTAIRSIPGNIGDAKEYGVEVNGSYRLKEFDLPNAIISGKYILRETEATDPYLEIERPIQYKQKHEWLITFQHDLVNSGTIYGFNITNKGPGGRGPGTGFRYDIIELWERTNDVKANAYIEQNVFNGMRLRFDVKNILNAKTNYQLTKYLSNISNNTVNYNEFRAASEARTYTLTLQGSF